MRTTTTPPTGATDRPTGSGTRYIYGLADAQGRVRYVGKATDVRSRLGGHLKTAQLGQRTSPVYAWLRELREPPTLVVLQVAPAADATRLEREWIRRLRATADPAAPLLNVYPDQSSAVMRRPKSREHRTAIAAGVRRHNQLHPWSPMACPTCGRSFRGSKGLNIHLRAAPACRALPVLGIAA